MVIGRRFPELVPEAIRDTRDALHAYSQLLGARLKAMRTRRKHWWHASLRPSLSGLTTGVVRASPDFELELDLVSSRLRLRMPERELALALDGQPAASVAAWLDEVLASRGDGGSAMSGGQPETERAFPAYTAAQARALQDAFASVTAALETFRAGIREETSPIQLWPHHFDLSMIWLPGPKVPGQDPDDEEYADKQMNFGFTLGDTGIAEPYFYVTAYPLPEALPATKLPPRTVWQSEGFDGAVLRYADLAVQEDPAAYLVDLWQRLLSAGRAHWVPGDP